MTWCAANRAVTTTEPRSSGYTVKVVFLNAQLRFRSSTHSVMFFLTETLCGCSRKLAWFQTTRSLSGPRLQQYVPYERHFHRLCGMPGFMIVQNVVQMPVCWRML